MTIYVISFFAVTILVSPTLCKMDAKERRFRSTFINKVGIEKEVKGNK